MDHERGQQRLNTLTAMALLSKPRLASRTISARSTSRRSWPGLRSHRLQSSDAGGVNTRGRTGLERAVSRRRFLGMLGLGAGTVAVAGAGGLTWRGIGTGVFDTGTGPAYVAWDEWRAGGGTLDMVRAAVLAANAHDTQPWLFRIAPARIDLFADTARNIGTMDPLCGEMQISLGCAPENLVLAGPPNGKLPSVLPMPKPSDGTHVAQVDLTPVAASTSPLFEAIPRRHTNRAAYDTGRALAPGALDALSGLID